MTTATYEITVETYTYTATMVTETGETTATLTARQDLDCPRRREIKCPGNCKCWYTLHYNINLQAYEPIHCNNCCIALYDIHFVPAVVATPEPVAVEETAQVQTVEEVAAGIEHYKSVIAAWDDEFDAPYQAPNEELSAETKELIAADTTPLNLDEPLALEARPSWMQPENATEATSEPDEQDALIAKLAFEADTEVDRQRYFAARSGKYVLLHQRADGLAVNCSCGDRIHRGRRAGRACKHMTAHNAMLAKPAEKQSTVTTERTIPMRDTSERFVNDTAEKDTACASCHLPIAQGESVIHDNLKDVEAHRVCPPLQNSIDAILDRTAA